MGTDSFIVLSDWSMVSYRAAIIRFVSIIPDGEMKREKQKKILLRAEATKKEKREATEKLLLGAAKELNHLLSRSRKKL